MKRALEETEVPGIGRDIRGSGVLPVVAPVIAMKTLASAVLASYLEDVKGNACKLLENGTFLMWCNIGNVSAELLVSKFNEIKERK